MTTGMLLRSLPSSCKKMVLKGGAKGRVSGVIRISTRRLSAWREGREEGRKGGEEGRKGGMEGGRERMRERRVKDGRKEKLGGKGGGEEGQR